MAARAGALLLASPDGSVFVVADTPNRGAKSRRPGRPDDRVPAVEPVPRRHHRGARAEPYDPSRYHRGGGRSFRRRRHRRDYDRSGQAPATRAWPNRSAAAKRRAEHSILHQSRTRRTCASPPRHAHAYACANLRQRRPAPAGLALAFGARRGGALRFTGFGRAQGRLRPSRRRPSKLLCDAFGAPSGQPLGRRW